MNTNYILALFLAIGAAGVVKIATAQKARQVSVVFLVLNALGSFAVLLATSVSNHLLLQAFVVAMIALSAAALSTVGEMKALSYAFILLISGISQAFIVSDSLLLQAFLWCLSGGALWAYCYRLNKKVTARIILVYHTPSMISLSVGFWLINEGNIRLGVSLVVLSVLVREFIMPFHSWVIQLFSDLPIAIAAIFVAPQIGVVLLFKLVQKGLMPVDMVNFIVWLCATTVVFTSICGLAQKDVRRAIAYIFISQSGLVIFGLEQHSDIAQAGSLFMWHSISLAFSGFAMAIAALEARIGLLSLSKPNGNFSITPRIAISVFILGFGSIGFPATIGFVAEDLLVQGSIDKSPILGLCLVLGTAINGMTIMKMFLYLFFGTHENLGQKDFTLRETSIVSALMGLMIFCGIFPNFLLS